MHCLWGGLVIYYTSVCIAAILVHMYEGSSWACMCYIICMQASSQTWHKNAYYERKLTFGEKTFISETFFSSPTRHVCVLVVYTYLLHTVYSALTLRRSHAPSNWRGARARGCCWVADEVLSNRVLSLIFLMSLLKYVVV